MFSLFLHHRCSYFFSCSFQLRCRRSCAFMASFSCCTFSLSLPLRTRLAQAARVSRPCISTTQVTDDRFLLLITEHLVVSFLFICICVFCNAYSHPRSLLLLVPGRWVHLYPSTDCFPPSLSPLCCRVSSSLTLSMTHPIFFFLPVDLNGEQRERESASESQRPSQDDCHGEMIYVLFCFLKIYSTHDRITRDDKPGGKHT